MASFLVKDIDPKFWRAVKAKAALEGVTMKVLILKLLAKWLATVVLVGLSAGCGGKDGSPTAPTTTTTTIPPVVTYTITGLVTVGTSSTPIAGAVLTVQDGVNVGKSATTDGAGRYTLPNLTPSGFTLAIAAAGYGGTSRGINLTTSGTANFQLLPTVLFARSGTGDTVFDMPTYLSRVRVQATYTGDGSNFVVYIAGRLIVNEIIGRRWPSTTFDGTYTTSGGVTEIRLSSGVSWTFTEVR